MRTHVAPEFAVAHATSPGEVVVDLLVPCTDTVIL